MSRFLRSIVLLLATAALGFGVAADLTIACGQGGGSVCNKVVQLASVAAEKRVDVTVTPGYEATIMVVGDLAWKYRTTAATATTDLPVAAAQSLTLTFTEATSFYELRTASDGTLCFVVLSVKRKL
jgi:hypothetical protein